MNQSRRAHRSFSSGAIPGSARAFTIVEALIVIAIIALLAGIVLGAIHLVKKSGDVAAEVGEVTALQKGVEKFRQDYNFLPPLVVDGPAAPVNLTTGAIATWSAADLADPNTTLNGSGGGTRKSYSEFSLAYYLCGALDAPLDGVDGLGFTAPSPNHDGSFTRRGRKLEPLVDVSQHKTRTGVLRLQIPNLPSNNVNKAACRILSRWSDGTNNKYIRYYRWQPTYYTDPAQNQPNPAPSPDLIGKVKDHNVPAILGDPASKPELRDAQYAIVSPGPDGLFGDEGDPAASKDNIVELGR